MELQKFHVFPRIMLMMKTKLLCFTNIRMYVLFMFHDGTVVFDFLVCLVLCLGSSQEFVFSSLICKMHLKVLIKSIGLKAKNQILRQLYQVNLK